MSDPTRLSDSRSTGSESLRRLLQAGRSEVPDDARLHGIASRLGFGLGSVPTGAAAKGVATVLRNAAVKTGAAAIIAVAGAGAVVTLATSPQRQPPVAAQSEPRAKPMVVTTTASAVSRPETPTPDVAPGPSGESLPRALPPRLIARVPSAKAVSGTEPASATAATAPEPPAAPPPTETEFSLVEKAQRALGSDPQRALALADRGESVYPTGPLAQEREVVAIEALIKLGRLDDARARGDRFARTFPGSAHAPRITQLLDSAIGVHNP